jgi:hypothetical protein
MYNIYEKKRRKNQPTFRMTEFEKYLVDNSKEIISKIPDDIINYTHIHDKEFLLFRKDSPHYSEGGIILFGHDHDDINSGQEYIYINNEVIHTHFLNSELRQLFIEFINNEKKIFYRNQNINKLLNT